MFVKCKVKGMNFFTENSKNRSSLNPIYSSTRPARNLVELGRAWHPLQFMTLLYKLSEVSFRSYEVLNIPSIAKFEK